MNTKPMTHEICILQNSYYHNSLMPQVQSYCFPRHWIDFSPIKQMQKTSSAKNDRSAIWKFLAPPLLLEDTKYHKKVWIFFHQSINIRTPSTRSDATDKAGAHGVFTRSHRRSTSAWLIGTGSYGDGRWILICRNLFAVCYY